MLRYFRLSTLHELCGPWVCWTGLPIAFSNQSQTGILFNLTEHCPHAESHWSGVIEERCLLKVVHLGTPSLATRKSVA